MPVKLIGGSIISPQGISGTGMQGSITKVDIQDAAGWHTIWKDGNTLIPSLNVVSGKVWELHVYARYYSPTGGYATFITVVGTGIHIAQGDRDEFGGTWIENKHLFGANMGIMPNGNIEISRIKLWMSNAYTVEPPPEPTYPW